jgi:cation:H+ antiporter
MLALLAVPAWTSDQPLLAILIGLVALVVGADLLVRGAVWIALTLGMSRMAVGLTLVAMGTSLPELLVTLTAARTGSSEIAMANVIGSNTANILLIVGAAAAICPIVLQVRRYELGYMLVATALVLFTVGLLRRERTHEEHPGHEPRPKATPVGWLVNLALLGIGLVTLAYGAEWLVQGAVSIAASLGMSEAVIGMTIVAVGTSLPELATSAVAAKKGQPEIAIGNVIGSNIFNVGSVLGIAGLLQPFAVDVGALGRLMVMTVVSAVLLTVVLRWRGGVSRGFGVLFLVCYFAFMTYEVVTGQV